MKLEIEQSEFIGIDHHPQEKHQHSWNCPSRGKLNYLLSLTDFVLYITLTLDLIFNTIEMNIYI